MSRGRALRFASWVLIASVPFAVPAHAVPFEAVKSSAVASVDRRAPDLTGLSDQIWAFAETALRETRSSAALADYAEGQGFTVRRGVADMPTAFVAEFGSGRPIVAILGEFDALPGVSQKAQPAREPLVAGAAGHGCGHNMFGAASLGAACAIKDLMTAGKLHGTIRFYGTPAEEAVGGKIYMLRAGLFKDVDICFAWHPDAETRADTKSTQALVDVLVEFHGRSAHAAFDPWNGRSAGDAAEVFTFAINLMREHVKPSVRMHYASPQGAKVPNVVPDYASVWLWVRDKNRTGVESVLERVRKAASGAGDCAGVESKLTIQSGDWEMLVNRAGARLLHDNLRWLGPVPFTPADHAFARAVQREAAVDTTGLTTRIEPLDEHPGDPDGGSTDVADVSWCVPTLHVSVATAPGGTPWHAWPVVACGGSPVGHAGLLYAAKVLAASMVDVYSSPRVLESIRTEFTTATRGVQYKGYIPDGPPRAPGN